MLQTANKLYIAQTRKVFYANIKIKIPAIFPEKILDESFALLEEIDLLYNSYQPNSYFSKINKNAGNWTEVDQITIDLLQKLIEISEITEGAYDITAMPLLQLWGFYKTEKLSVPTYKEINESLQNVDFQKIKMDGLKVKIESGQQIITGSFLKAFAIDILAERLKNQGVSDAIINAGGSTIYALNDEVHLNWNINIPHPFQEGEKLAKISLQNLCYSLSAKANNYVEIDSKKYGHILNSKSGFPSDAVQVGVICKSAFFSDVLSTALFSLEEKDFERIVKKLQANFDFQAYRIHKNGTIANVIFNLEASKL